MVLSNEEKTKNDISLIIDSIINIIKNPDMTINSSSFLYHQSAQKKFIINIYTYKLLINDNNYLNEIIENSKIEIEDSKTNIEYSDTFDLLIKIKELLCKGFCFDEINNKIVFPEEKYIDSDWFIEILSKIFININNKKSAEINIRYTIPNKSISKLTEKIEVNDFISNFTYYNIKVKHVDETKKIKENSILIVKNAAINYLKHLKQYKHGLENEESYLIFYNLLKNECRKEGFELEEKEDNLINAENKIIEKINEIIDDEFYSSGLSRQVHLIENVVWQSSNDITLLEHMNKSIDELIKFISLLNNNPKEKYLILKQQNNINDIQIILLLITNKYLLTYLYNRDEIDYSLLNLANIKPKYMNSIYKGEEQEIKTKLKNLNVELSSYKRDIEQYKEERKNINKITLGNKYQQELERCVGNINRTSITIGRLNSNISSLSRRYEEIKKEQENKYHNVDLYNYNHSIIKHLCNSILSCSFYLKTNNTSSLLNNIIIFEDYEKTDNSFYLEVTFKDLLKISNQNIINGIIDQFDLPRLA